MLRSEVGARRGGGGEGGASLVRRVGAALLVGLGGRAQDGVTREGGRALVADLREVVRASVRPQVQRTVAQQRAKLGAGVDVAELRATVEEELLEELMTFEKLEVRFWGAGALCVGSGGSVRLSLTAGVFCSSAPWMWTLGVVCGVSGIGLGVCRACLCRTGTATWWTSSGMPSRRRAARRRSCGKRCTTCRARCAMELSSPHRCVACLNEVRVPSRF